MGRSYYCPHCRKLLNPGTKVIFLVENGPEMELVLLSANLGDYSVVTSRSMSLLDGAIYTFRCPLCRADLTSSENDKLVDLLSRAGEDESPVRVSFSRIHGEHATFLMADDGVDRFGEHADRYDNLNFFGEAKDSLKD
jgi:hypothetical protein